ncbi:BON domain-containing protein [Paraburkholderia strydomiana]|uniref:BON domain-containing protein n=1 Tax=Paraburkholderia strydomiana TaxID=1245417 RepID=UPI0038BDFB45
MDMTTVRKALIVLVAFVLSAGSAVNHAQPQPSRVAGTAVSKKEARQANRQTERAVRRALTRAKGLDASRITVFARDGAVTLAGSVPDAAQIPLAESAAQNVPEATSLKVSLSVKELGT